MLTSSSSRIRRTGAALAAATFALTVVSACGSRDAPTGSGAKSYDKATTVTTKLLSFSPEKLTVKVGQTVTWHVADSIGHTVTTGTFKLGSEGLRTSENPDGVLDMPLKPGKDVTFTFTKAGDYVYFCSIHKGMNGEVVVTE